MNKKLITIPILTILVLMSACSKTPTTDTLIENDTSLSKVIPEEKIVEEESEEIKEEKDSSGVDHDIITMSPTLSAGLLGEIMWKPWEHLGETLRLAGNFEIYPIEDTDEKFCLIMFFDEMGCCPQGIQIIFPEDMEMPEAFTDIIMIGSVNMDVNEYLVLDVVSWEPDNSIVE